MESVFFGDLKKGLEIRRLWELKRGPDNSTGGEVCLGYTTEMVLEWEPTQTPDCHRIPLTLRQPLCHSQLPIQSRGSPKALLARKTLGIPSSEKTL